MAQEGHIMFARFASKSADAGFTRGEVLFLHASIRDASSEFRVDPASPLRAVAGHFPSRPI
jgi:hypothetical protein